MFDPLAEVVSLLQPSLSLSKVVSGGGAWRVQRSEIGEPFYCAILDGGCLLSIAAHAPITLQAGDFVLIPAAYDFALTSLAPLAADHIERAPLEIRPRHMRVGSPDVPADVQLLVGHCTFGSPDAALLVSLLPHMVHVRGEPRLTTLVQLLTEEAREQRPARDVILAHLLNVLFIEALRSSANANTSPGLLRGLGDERLAVALRQMHEHPDRPWTVVQLAKEAALSRSTFFERFTQAVGATPMVYLLAWRMGLAKHLLRRQGGNVSEVAQQVGYGSASAFSVAFTRYTGLPPARYSRGDVSQ